METTIIDIYSEDQRIFIIEALRRIEYLSEEFGAPEAFLIKLSYLFKQVSYEKDIILADLGDKIDKMHIIVSGSLKIIANLDNFPVTIDVLTAGSSLNGDAFL